MTMIGSKASDLIRLLRQRGLAVGMRMDTVGE
jgi:hypothetical protein